MAKCEHFIGVLYEYDDTDIARVDDIKRHIEYKNQIYKGGCEYTFSDYCDKRKSTNFTHFNYCPMCGEKIDWKTIKRSEQNEKLDTTIV